MQLIRLGDKTWKSRMPVFITSLMVVKEARGAARHGVSGGGGGRRRPHGCWLVDKHTDGHVIYSKRKTDDTELADKYAKGV